MRDYLVMPSHVFAAVSAPAVKGRQHWILLKKDVEYVELDTDLIAIKCSEKELSTIGASQVSISHSLPYSGEYVSIVGASGKGTVGVLRHDRSIFGRVTYDGTTVGGYSGAGYCSGNRLVGIHTNGGAVNGGFSASYIYSLICRTDKVKPEDSDDWLREQFSKKSGRGIRVDKRWNDMDEVRIEVNGRYAIVDRSSMVTAFGKGWMDELPGFSEPRADYREECVASHSGEAKDSEPGDSSSKKSSPDQDIPEVSALIEILTKLSQKKLKKVSTVITKLDEVSDTRLQSVVDQLTKKE